MKTLLFTIKKLIKEKVIYRNYKPSKKVFLHKCVPYFPQWESRNLVKDIISGKISAKDDPLWKNSGARTTEEYELWSWNACGMACLKMVLGYKLKQIIPILKLGKRCMEFGGYKGKNLEGLFYEPFLKFIQHDFGLGGKIYSPMILSDIIQELEKGNLVIASASPEIRNPKSNPGKRGGHLVLIVGYDFNKKLLFIHNPSGTTQENQEYAKISFYNFKKFFAYRGISIKLFSYKTFDL